MPIKLKKAYSGIDALLCGHPIVEFKPIVAFLVRPDPSIERRIFPKWLKSIHRVSQIEIDGILLGGGCPTTHKQGIFCPRLGQ